MDVLIQNKWLYAWKYLAQEDGRCMWITFSEVLLLAIYVECNLNLFIYSIFVH